MPSEYLYYRALALALDDVTTSVTVTGASAPSTAICAQLVNATSGVSSGRWEGAWVLNTAGAGAPQQRRVAQFTPGTGTLTITPVWTSTPSIGDTIELTQKFPAMPAAASVTDYRALINAALGHIWVDGIELTASISTADTVSLSGYPGIRTADQIQDVLEPHPISGRSPVSAMWRVRDVIVSSGVTTLRLKSPFARAHGTLTVRVRLQASAYIATAGTWSAASIAGLVNLSDEARPPVQDVVDVALVEAYQALLRRKADPTLAKQLADQRVVARRVPGYDGGGVRSPEPEPVAA